MKRFLALALAVVFVLGFAAAAYAAHLEVVGNGSGIRLTGEFRVRGIAQDNLTDFDDNIPDKMNWYEQRYRMYLDALIGDDVEVRTRFTLGDGDWDGTTQTRTAGGGGGYQLDHAYVVIKKFGGSWYLGLQPANWGNKFWSWGGIQERVKYVSKVSDALTLGAFLQKNTETYSGSGGSDSDSLSILAIVKPVADHKISVIYVETNNNISYVDATALDIAYAGKIGPASILAEYATTDTDTANTGTDGLFVSGSFDLSDMINLGATFATVNDGFDTDDDWAPTLLIGRNVHPTAVFELGDNLNNTSLNQDDSASAIVVSGMFKLSDDLTLGANIGQILVNDNGSVVGGVDNEILELDLWASYKLATNTSLWVGYAQASPDYGFVTEDDITSAAWQVKTLF